MADPRRCNRQLAVFLLGVLLVKFPLLGLIDAIRLPGNVPLTPVYLFAVWLGLILVTAALTDRRRGGA